MPIHGAILHWRSWPCLRCHLLLLLLLPLFLLLLLLATRCTNMTHKDNRTHLAVRGRNGQTYFAGQQNGNSGAYFDGEATVRKGLKDYNEINTDYLQ